ncbi:MAG: hypothetical protein AAGF23_10965 [Acidobacteriota bacterium]
MTGPALGATAPASPVEEDEIHAAPSTGDRRALEKFLTVWIAIKKKLHRIDSLIRYLVRDGRVARFADPWRTTEMWAAWPPFFPPLAPTVRPAPTPSPAGPSA